MKSPLLFVSATLGAAAGIIAGLVSEGSGVTARSVAMQSKQTVARSPVSRASLPPGQELVSDDARIARVLGSFYQPVKLRARSELLEALREIGPYEIPVLIKRAELMESDSSEAFSSALVERWFELDSGAAQKWVQDHSDEWNNFAVWARTDPESAFRVATTTSKWWASSLAADSLTALYGDNAVEKLARVRSLPPGGFRDSLVGIVISGWSVQDPAAALAALPEIPSASTREEVRGAILIRLAERDPAGALEKLEELVPTFKAGVLGNDLLTRVAAQVAEKDPRLALEWLKGIPAEFGAIPAIAAAREWADKEPIPALSWCIANGVDVARAQPHGVGMWQGGVLAEAMTKAPLETVALFEALPPGAERQRLLECAFKESLWHTPPDQLFDGENPLVWRLLRQMPEDAQAASAGHLGQRLGEKGDLTELSTWAQNFAPGQARANAIASAVGASYRRDTSQVDKLLATAATGADRDAALHGLAQSMSYNVPRDAALQALNISDASLRKETLENVIGSWLKSDPQASRTWLNGASSIPDAWKSDWLRRASDESEPAGR